MLSCPIETALAEAKVPTLGKLGTFIKNLCLFYSFPNTGPVKLDERIHRLVLMAPSTGFFAAPDALAQVHTPIQAWVGTNDLITPPVQAELLKQALGNLVDLRIVEGAGHFSFMNILPLQITDSIQNRESLLEHLTIEILRFIKL